MRGKEEIKMERRRNSRGKISFQLTRQNGVPWQG